jgi:hypothetical protein
LPRDGVAREDVNRSNGRDSDRKTADLGRTANLGKEGKGGGVASFKELEVVGEVGVIGVVGEEVPGFLGVELARKDAICQRKVKTKA